MLQGALERSLEEAALALRVRRWMEATGLKFGALEASVRVGEAPSLGGRMMIERVSPSAVAGFFDALGAPTSEPVERLVSEATKLELPMIVGWDRSRGAPWAKLYANASDKSQTVRSRLAAGLGLDAAPHILGLNVSDDGATETKVYVQSRAHERGRGHPVFLPFLRAGIDGGWVESSTLVRGTLVPRGLFLATPEGHPAVSGLLASLGYDRALAEGLPFAAGSLRSIGVGEADRVTLYVKPRGSTPEMWALEPVLVAREPNSEVGLFVEPAAFGRRAWAIVGAHALSYRVRHGDVERESLERLLSWAKQALIDGTRPDDLTTLAVSPRGTLPEPWHVERVP